MTFFHYDELLLLSHHHTATFPPSYLFHCFHFLMNVHDPWRLFCTAAHLPVCLWSSVSLSLTPTQCVFVCLVGLRGRCGFCLYECWGEMQEENEDDFWSTLMNPGQTESRDRLHFRFKVFFLFLFSNSYYPLMFRNFIKLLIMYWAFMVECFSKLLNNYTITVTAWEKNQWQFKGQLLYDGILFIISHSL